MARKFSELELQLSPARRRRAKARADAMLREMLLAELRKHSGMTQAQLARALGVKQPTLSKLENAGDMQISTLRRLLQALGGELKILAKLEGKTIELSQFADNPKAA